MSGSNFVSLTTIAAGLCAVFLSGCATGPKVYNIRGEADPIVNRDVGGAPLSVVVRLYQLKDAGEFSKLTFDTLASGRPEAELLGPELLEKTEVVLVPGSKHVSTDKLREDAKYVGVVAFFRRPDQHYWRYLIDADKVRSEGLTFRAQDCYLTLLNVKPTPIPGQPQGGKPECVVVQATPVAQPTNAQAGQVEPPKSATAEKDKKAKNKTHTPKGKATAKAAKTGASAATTGGAPNTRPIVIPASLR
jgi:type VI secretion system protein VasD